MKKKIFLAYGYSQKNAGDLAISIGALDFLILQQGYNVVLLSRYSEADNEYKKSSSYYQNRYGEALKILPSPFYLNRSGTFLSQAKNYLKSIYNYLFLPKNTNIVKHIKECDFVVFNGGNLLRCSSLQDYIRLVALNFPLKLARKHHKKYIIFPQSSALINNQGKKIINSMLKPATTVFIREELSYSKLKKEFNLNNLVRTIDLAFFIDKKNIQESNDDGSKVIAFTFRAHTVGDLKEMEDEEKEKIKKEIDKIISRYSKDLRLIFVVQTLKDRLFTLELQQYYNDKYQINIEYFESYDPIELMNFYSKIDLLVGMRLHSIILAASVGTPCFGIFFEEWGLKNPGMMNQLSLPFVIIDQKDNVNCDAIDELLIDKLAFKKHINSIIKNEYQKIESFLEEL